MARLKQFYTEKLRPSLMQKFNYSNILQTPRLEKIVVNIGVGENVADSKKINAAVDDLALITGQKPSITKAKKSIAGFKLKDYLRRVLMVMEITL